MNIILFKPNELETPLPRTDSRAVHITSVLNFGVGDTFDMGVFDGPKGKATIEAISQGQMSCSFKLEDHIPSLYPVELIIGAPRPQSARRILREATALGVRRLMFCATEKGVGSYLKSKLWTTDEYKRHLEDGAQQAFCTRIPIVELFDDLASCVAAVDSADNKVALDNYEATVAIQSATYKKGLSTTLAIGSERGWSAGERDTLRQQGFTLAHLGERVLRTETCCVAGLAVVLAATQY